MGSRDLPDMSALALGRCAPLGSCVHIRQIIPAHVTYITYMYVCKYICTYNQTAHVHIDIHTAWICIHACVWLCTYYNYLSFCSSSCTLSLFIWTSCSLLCWEFDHSCYYSFILVCMQVQYNTYECNYVYNTSIKNCETRCIILQFMWISYMCIRTHSVIVHTAC